MKQPNLLLASLSTILAFGTLACVQADDPGAEDVEDGDKGVLAIGLENDAPDVLALLQIANTYTADELFAAGLSKKAATNIEAARIANGPFTSLQALDKVERVGATAIGELLTYVTRERLFPTSLRIPTVSRVFYYPFSSWLEDDLPPEAAALRPHMWLNDDYSHADFYAQLKTQLEAEGRSEDDVAYTLRATSFYDLAHLQHGAQSGGMRQPCWIGDPIDAVYLVAAQAGTLFPDGYEVFGWRFGIDGEVHGTPTEGDFTTASKWINHSPNSKTVLLAEGVERAAATFTTLGPCRTFR